GLETFFTPGQEILVTRSPAETITAVTTHSELLAQVGSRAKERALDCHTAAHRAQRLIELIDRSVEIDEEWNKVRPAHSLSPAKI
ncbi:MAG: glycosyltransferase family 1 protein, partial [Acidobacteriaceae bacterium]|nr:glycosyltransferase family 1 protein [Acidobacteriaceae bacterium]